MSLSPGGEMRKFAYQTLLSQNAIVRVYPSLFDGAAPSQVATIKKAAVGILRTAIKDFDAEVKAGKAIYPSDKNEWNGQE